VASRTKKHSFSGAGKMAIGGGMREDQEEEEELVLVEDREEEEEEGDTTLDDKGREMNAKARAGWQHFDAASVRTTAMTTRVVDSKLTLLPRLCPRHAAPDIPLPWAATPDPWLPVMVDVDGGGSGQMRGQVMHQHRTYDKSRRSLMALPIPTASLSRLVSMHPS